MTSEESKALINYEDTEEEDTNITLKVKNSSDSKVLDVVVNKDMDLVSDLKIKVAEIPTLTF